MSYLAKSAHYLERLVDRFKPVRGRGQLLIQPYIGYSSPEGAVVRGRVLEHSESRLLRRLGAFGAMAIHFVTSEVPGAVVHAGSVETVTDEEGYFTVTVPLEEVSEGSVTATMLSKDYTVNLPVVLTSRDAQRGIISDIDDTVIETGAWSIFRNLWTTFSVKSVDRVVFDDTAALIRMLEGASNPVFYVSSSPWNIHDYLSGIFARAEIPFGPKFLRDLGVDDTKFIKSSHGSHKGDAIDTILAANPSLPFVLIGDTGQHDAQVYLDAIHRHPGRIEAVYLRGAGKQDEADRTAAAAISATNVALHVDETFTSFLKSELPKSQIE